MAAILMGCAIAASASGYTSARVGVDSNFLIHEGRVYFVQADESLTVLDLETGAVLSRVTEFPGAHVLEWTDAGILARSYEQAVLVNPRTLKVERSTAEAASSARPHGSPGTAAAEPENGDEGRLLLRLPGGVLLMERSWEQVRGIEVETVRPITLRWKSVDGDNWSGCIPYLGSPGTIVSVGGAGDRILLGSNLGHVECIDARTGRSLWMYLFPMLRQTLSYSALGRPPYATTAAAIHRKENADRRPATGFVRDDGASPSRPVVVLDPAPFDPFANLALYEVLAWSGGVTTIFLPILLLRMQRQRSWNCLRPAPWILACLFLVSADILYFGRISIGSSIALRVGFLFALTSLIRLSIRCLRARERLPGTTLLAVSLVTAFVMWPAILLP